MADTLMGQQDSGPLYPLDTTFNTDFWTAQGVPLQPQAPTFLENVGTFIEGATKPFADLWTGLTGGATKVLNGAGDTLKNLPVIVIAIAVTFGLYIVYSLFLQRAR